MGESTPEQVPNGEVDKNISIVITLTPDGKVGVGGPINDKLLCYGLLESAKDAIRDFKMPQDKIIKPHGIMDFAKRRF